MEEIDIFEGINSDLSIGSGVKLYKSSKAFIPEFFSVCRRSP